MFPLISYSGYDFPDFPESPFQESKTLLQFICARGKLTEIVFIGFAMNLHF